MQKQNYRRTKIVIALVLIGVIFGVSVTQVTAVSFISITTSASIKTLTTDTTYEKAISVSVKFTPNIDTGAEVVPYPKIYTYVVKQGQSVLLASATKNGSTFVNETEQIVTTTLYIDEDSVAGQQLKGGDTLIIYGKVYNETVETANYLGGNSTSLDYGDLVKEAAEEEGISLTTYLILGSLGVAGIAFAILVVIWAYTRARGMLH